MPLRNISRRKLTAALRDLGFEVNQRRGKGSHAIVSHPDDPSRMTTLPARDPVATGTLRRMINDLGVTREQLEEAL